MEEKIKELSIYRFDKANKSLLVAEKLFAEGEYGYSQNRAYYALFDAIRSITALDGFDSSKHSGIIAHFNQCYVKTSIFSPNTSSIIRLASMLREKSDYEDFYEPDKEDTKEIIDSVRTFLREVSNYLKQQGIL